MPCPAHLHFAEVRDAPSSVSAKSGFSPSVGAAVYISFLPSIPSLSQSKEMPRKQRLLNEFYCFRSVRCCKTKHEHKSFEKISRTTSHLPPAPFGGVSAHPWHRCHTVSVSKWIFKARYGRKEDCTVGRWSDTVCWQRRSIKRWS